MTREEDDSRMAILTPAAANDLKMLFSANSSAAAIAAFAEHVIKIACSRGEGDMLHSAVNETHDPLERKILSVVAAVKAAMVEGEFYQVNSALTGEPQPFPVDVDEPNPQRRMTILVRDLRDEVAGLLKDLPSIEDELIVPYASLSAGQGAEGAVISIVGIASLIAAIAQLRELTKTNPNTSA